MLTFSVANDIPAGTTFTLVTPNLRNPVSIYPVTNTYISTMARYAGDAQYWRSDYIATVPDWTTLKGDLNEAAISLSMLYGETSTYKPGNVLSYKFTSKHTTP